MTEEQRWDIKGGSIRRCGTDEKDPNESNIPRTDRRLLDGIRFVCPRPEPNLRSRPTTKLGDRRHDLSAVDTPSTHGKFVPPGIRFH
jgi:hypothetical protein